MRDSLDLDAAVFDFHPKAPADIVRDIRGLRFNEPGWLFGWTGDDGPWQGDMIEHGELAYRMANETMVHAGPCMLLSHGCDTVPGQAAFSTLAPVFALDDFLSDVPELQRASKRDAIRHNRILDIFFLPAHGKFPDRFVKFSMASAVATELVDSTFRATPAEERLRLTQRGWYLLTCKLCYHLTRMEGEADYPRAA